jgi:hypothetical protein
MWLSFSRHWDGRVLVPPSAHKGFGDPMTHLNNLRAKPASLALAICLLANITPAQA